MVIAINESKNGKKIQFNWTFAFLVHKEKRRILGFCETCSFQYTQSINYQSCRKIRFDFLLRMNNQWKACQNRFCVISATLIQSIFMQHNSHQLIYKAIWEILVIDFNTLSKCLCFSEKFAQNLSQTKVLKCD